MSLKHFSINLGKIYRKSLQNRLQINYRKKATTPLKSQGKWLFKENIIGNAVNVNWENTCRLPFLSTTEKNVTSVPIHVPSQTNSNKLLPL